MPHWIADISNFWVLQQARFYKSFIVGDRWTLLVTGVRNTLAITFFACLIGIAIGMLIAIIRTTHDKNVDTMGRGAGRFFLKFLNGICKFYLTVIRGTPVVVQLFIMVFVIFASEDAFRTAILTFGINSGAYVAEIIRSGIMSIDKGQFEAGRSLGFNYIETMRYIIMPQALKNVIPPLANEFIVLLKETAVAGWVGVTELTRNGQKIMNLSYDAMYAYLAIGVVYLVLVMFFTWLVGKLERRLMSRGH